MPRKPVVSVVMPCLNEALTLGGCIAEARDALWAADIPFEIIIADNGSTDGSVDIAVALGPRLSGSMSEGTERHWLPDFPRRVVSLF